MSRAGKVGLIAALVVTALGTAYWALAGRGLPAPAPSREGSLVPVSGIAERFLVTYLAEAGEDHGSVLLPYLGYAPPLDGMTPGSWYPSHVTTVDVATTDAGWSVLLAACLLTRSDGGYRDAGTSYFRVDVVPTEDGLGIADLPSATDRPAPAGQTAPPPEADPTDSPVFPAADSFLTWYLTDTLAIGQNRPIGTYSSATIQSLVLDESGQRAQVRVLATDPSGSSLVLTFTLDVRLDPSGRWSVLGIAE